MTQSIQWHINNNNNVACFSWYAKPKRSGGSGSKCRCRKKAWEKQVSGHGSKIIFYKTLRSPEIFLPSLSILTSQPLLSLSLPWLATGSPGGDNERDACWRGYVRVVFVWVGTYVTELQSRHESLLNQSQCLDTALLPHGTVTTSHSYKNDSIIRYSHGLVLNVTRRTVLKLNP